MKTLHHNWIRFWIFYGLLFIALGLADIELFLFVFGPLGIFHGMLIGAIIWAQIDRKEFSIPYYIYLVVTVIISVIYFVK